MRILQTFVLLFTIFLSETAFSTDLPDDFLDTKILSSLSSPASYVFSPDGRIMFSERISGNIRVASYDQTTDEWTIEPAPYFTFGVPPSQHRSSGIRGIAFDPDFLNNGYVYVFYMRDSPRQNIVVRIQQDPNNSNQALPDSEEALLEVPFNSTGASGSHNGGDLVFGLDGKLYITTGDGWNGGDYVQSLSTFTGKLLRINPTPGDIIPTDNPFYEEADGNYRAIYCLGLRNPYSMSIHPETGNIYVNDAVGDNKDRVLQVRADGSDAGANFGHDGYNGIGTEQSFWAETANGGKILITGGAWYPSSGYWPEQYRGNYFYALWGSNYTDNGLLGTVASETDTSIEIFATNVGEITEDASNKPVFTKVGPDGNVYYMLTDYETEGASIHRITYDQTTLVAAAPAISPGSGNYENAVQVAMATGTPNAAIYYTVDGSDPDETSSVYTTSFTIEASTIVKARAFAEGYLASSISSVSYEIGIGANIPPVADAGPDIKSTINTVVTLNGADSYDPDGSTLETNEYWEQVSGPSVFISDSDETVANFTPSESGIYVFEIQVTDIEGATDTDQVTVVVVDAIDDVLTNLIARWSMEEGSGSDLEDTSPNNNTGDINGAAYVEDANGQSNFSLQFDGQDDQVDIGTLDLTGDALTITFWAKAESFGVSDARILCKATGTATQDHYWMVSTFDGNIRVRLKTDDGVTSTLVATNTPIDLNTWSHFAIVYNGAAITVYKDGALTDQLAKSGSLASAPSLEAAIGNHPGNIDKPFHGFLDEMRIYSVALTQQEIETVKNATICNKSILPVADAGSNIEVEVGANVELDGSGSYDSEGTLLLYAWEQQSGAVVDIASSSDPVAAFVPTEAGSYVFKLTVANECGVFAENEVTINVTSGEEENDYLSNLLARWSMEEGTGSTLEDVSSNENTGTISGAIFSPEANSLSNYSLSFDGVDDQVDIGNLDLVGDEVSFTFWIRPNSLEVTDARILCKATGTAEQDHYWMISGFEGNLRVRLKTDTEGTRTLVAKNTPVPIGQWTHFAIVYDGSTVDVFSNGTLTDQMSLSGALSTSNAVEAAIGNHPGDIDKPFDGLIDELRIYAIALNSEQINLVQSALTYGSESSSLVASWTMESNTEGLLIDVSANGNDGTVLGATYSEDTNGQSIYSLNFDGVDDQVDIGNMDLSGSELSITFWAKPRSFGVNDARILSKATGTAEQDHYWMVSTFNGNLRVRLKTNEEGTSTLIGQNTPLSLDEWQHFAVIYSGSTLSIYKNGTLTDQLAKSGNITTAPGVAAAIGNQPGNTDKPFDGLLDEIQIYNTALSEEELLQLYQGGYQESGRSIDHAVADGEEGFAKPLIYPNPVSDLLFVNVHVEASPYRWKVMDLFGKVIFQADTSVEAAVAIDVSVLEKGIYVLSIQYSNGKMRNELFLKR